MTLETMESLRALWREDPSRPERVERSERRDRQAIEEAARPPEDAAVGLEQRRFNEWLERVGYEEGSLWCCPVEEGFVSGWRAGYADGVHAAMRLLRAAYDPAESANALHPVGRDVWGATDERDEQASIVPLPVPFRRARRR